MKRQTFTIADSAMNCQPEIGYTQIPNDLLRNPEISGKAKALICLLLSNQKGWKSNITTISTMMKEGETAIYSAVKELQEHGYLKILKYRYKESKQFAGSFWVYTNVQEVFDMESPLNQLDKYGLELVEPLENKGIHPQTQIPVYGKPKYGSSRCGKPSTNNTNSKKTNSKNTKKNKQKNIFMELLPKKWREDEELNKLVVAYLNHRREKRSSLTPTAMRNLGLKLSRHSLPCVKQALTATLENGWLGVFPENVGNAHFKNGGNIASGHLDKDPTWKKRIDEQERKYC